MDKTIKQVTRENFETDEAYNSFLEFTKPIFTKRNPKMPFSKLSDYLNEYNLIQEGKSSLTATQRIKVKNVIHVEVRNGNIKLLTIDVKDEV